MIHPLAGLLSPRRVIVFGCDDKAVGLQQNLAAGGVETILIESSSDTPRIPVLQSAPGQPDIAFIFDNPKQALIECSYAGVPAAVVCSDDADSWSAPSSVRVLQVGSGHFARPHQNILLSEGVPAGKVALLSNTELVADALILQLAQRDIGTSFYASVAPHSDVHLDDLLDLLEHDEQSETIGLYLDQPARPRMLLDVLARLTPEKPVVALLPAGNRTSTWNALLQHVGVTTVHSFGEFGNVISAFSAPRHGGRWQRPAQTPMAQDSDWHYTSAMRHLSGIDPSKEVVDVDEAGIISDFDRQRVYVSNKASHPFATHLTGAPAAVHTAWQHAIMPTPSIVDLPKDVLRQELSAIPSGQAASLPYIQALLQQAGIPLVDGLWLTEGQPVEIQIRAIGQPVDAWVVRGNGQSEIYRNVGIEKLRRLHRRAERIWVQAAPRSGVEVLLNAERHPEFGPVMSCQPTLPMGDMGRLEYALPLNKRRAAILAEQLLPAHLGDQKGLISTLESIGHLFASLPELQKLDALVVCQPKQSRVSDAHLEWLP